MHPLEAELVQILEKGGKPQLEALGGIAAVASAASSLGSSPVMPELLDPIVRGWQCASPGERESFRTALRDLLEAATSDFALMEAVDILEAHRPLPDDTDESCFMLFLSKSARRGVGLSGLARSAALEGAFRWATANRRWQHRLLDFLLSLSVDDDPEFLRHAAKIAGVGYSHWRERDLLDVLAKLHALDAAKAEAAFELGMASLAEALDAGTQSGATAGFREARSWFREAADGAELHPEAGLYLDCISQLMDYSLGGSRQSLSDASDRVQRFAFELVASGGGDGRPSWLGSRRTEAACWNMLASSIAGLAMSLDEPSWWQPAAVIEEALITVYGAGRSILRRTQQGGIEELLRPRITKSLSTQAGQAHHLKVWLEHNAEHEWASEARDLIQQINLLIDSSGDPNNPSTATSDRASLVAIISQAHLPQEAMDRVLSVVSNAVILHLQNMTGAEVEVIERCSRYANEHTDYRDNLNGQKLFSAALLWAVRFVFTRLEISRRDDPSGNYLFERDDGKLPHEDELQADFFRWLAANVAGTDIEATNVGSGRADLRLKASGDRLVIEVKREESDSSFEALSRAYSAQATDYQNVSIRLGVLLVLDLATPNREGTPHLTSLFEMRDVCRPGEAVARKLLIVKVPGRRRLPSELTKTASRHA